MKIRRLRPAIAIVLAVTALLAAGCSSQTKDATTSATPTVSEPPSTPVKEDTLTDPSTGATATPLAIVTTFSDATPSTNLSRAVLVKVKVTAGDKITSSIGSDELTITKRNQDLEYQTLGLCNSDELTDPMKKAGYTPLQTTREGSSTGWLGCWVDKTVTQFDLVYDRPAGQVIGGSDSGKEVPAAQDIVQIQIT